MIDAIEERIESEPEQSDKLLPKALELCDELATKHDTIRKNYWNYVKNQLESKFQKTK